VMMTFSDPATSSSIGKFIIFLIYETLLWSEQIKILDTQTKIREIRTKSSLKFSNLTEGTLISLK
jgi:hypothetical protein